MAHQYSGECSCGHVSLVVTLEHELTEYSPRACDCDFCMSRHIEYLSEPTALLQITHTQPLQSLQQGSNQAEFLACSRCHDVVAVVYQADTQLIGAVNACLLKDRRQLKPSVVVSPKKLSADEKSGRWASLWGSVTITASIN